jgi:hypothetical protein
MSYRRRYRDDLIDTMHVFRREKYKARFLQTSYGETDISQRILQSIRESVNRPYGMVGRPGLPDNKIAKVDFITPVVGLCTNSNGFMKTPSSQRYDIL